MTKRILLIVILVFLGNLLSRTDVWGYVHEFGHVLIGGGSIVSSHGAVVRRGGLLTTAAGNGMEVWLPAFLFIVLSKVKKSGVFAWIFFGAAVFSYTGSFGYYEDWLIVPGSQAVHLIISTPVLAYMIFTGVKRIIQDAKERKKHRREVLAYWLKTP